MNLLFFHLRQSLRRPDHWLYGSWLDIVTKYRKTYLGLSWVFVPIAVYIWGIGGFISALQPGANTQDFLAHVAVGFVVFRFIMTVLSDATAVFSGFKPYIYDGSLRLTDLIFRMINRSFCYFLLALPVVAVAVFASQQFEWLGILGSMLGMAAVLVNLFFYSVLLSLLGARFPDLSEFMSSAMMASFLITPVVWYPDMAPAGTIQGAFMRANPFHHLLASVRAPLLGEPLEQLTIYYLVATTVLGLVAAPVAYQAFARRVPLWL
ncbi:hypothetical protein IEQ11_18625 [Lysobacter capsici]|uniref:ABC transporter permease n=1 Tax=Lysobacter capsici TaxID=435897 RepID=UPI00177E096C|nr:hypothetical protein [Lysobacter capsici]UOF13739.1 hypothetical protein IEQ11_18625 [Lysobacter capsici]